MVSMQLANRVLRASRSLSTASAQAISYLSIVDHSFYNHRAVNARSRSIWFSTSSALVDHVENRALDNKDDEVDQFDSSNGDEVERNAEGNQGFHPCGRTKQSEQQPLPPPQPEPKFSFYKRPFPTSKISEGSEGSARLIGWSSEEGQKLFMESMSAGFGKKYFVLAEHFANQLEPAYCAFTTLIMVLNSMCVDPNVRWRGGWRFFGDEEVLIGRCCISREKVQRAGITLEEFVQLAKCQGVSVSLHRPNERKDLDKDFPKIQESDSILNTIDDFRSHVIEATSSVGSSTLVVSFGRGGLGQTGDGHFSPVAGYHKETDRVLILDVARFKYPPYWVDVDTLFNAMCLVDQESNESRGWCRLNPPKGIMVHGGRITDDKKRPASVVPLASDGEMCPVGSIKVEFCPVSQNKDTMGKREV